MPKPHTTTAPSGTEQATALTRKAFETPTIKVFPLTNAQSGAVGAPENDDGFLDS